MSSRGVERSFDALEFANYVLSRWRFALAACAIAATVTLGISLLLPKKYTATASLLIESPGGSDARITTAVSPVYLESLRSYEHLAASDTLFRKAVDRFQLRVSDTSSLEATKARVLRVSKLRDTRVLQISVTLPDPNVAQAMAQFLAEESLTLNEALVNAGGQELESTASTDRDQATRELEQLRAEWQEITRREPVERLQAELKTLTELIARLREQLLETEAEIAADEQRQKESPAWKALVEASQAKAAVMHQQRERLERDLEIKTAALASAQTKRQVIEGRMKAAQTVLDNAEVRLHDVRTPFATRGERLRIIDPGVVPERPTSPNTLLNVLVAIFTSAFGALLYLGITFQTRPSTVRLAAKSFNG